MERKSMETLDIITIVTCVVTIIFLVLWIWCAMIQQGLLVKIYNDLEAIIEGYVPPPALNANIQKTAAKRRGVKGDKVPDMTLEDLQAKMNMLIAQSSTSGATA